MLWSSLSSTVHCIIVCFHFQLSLDFYRSVDHFASFLLAMLLVF